MGLPSEFSQLGGRWAIGPPLCDREHRHERHENESEALNRNAIQQDAAGWPMLRLRLPSGQELLLEKCRDWG